MEVAERGEEAYLDLTFTLGHVLVGRITHWLFSVYLVGFMQVTQLLTPVANFSPSQDAAVFFVRWTHTAL